MQGTHPDALAVARALLAAGGPAALATSSLDGVPFASYVVAATGPEQSPILLLSGLAVHTQNLMRDPRASLLFVGARGRDAEPMTAPRLTLVGRAARHPDQPAAARAYLAAYPEAGLYAGFADFACYGFLIDGAHVVAGFGRIVALTAGELLGKA